MNSDVQIRFGTEQYEKIRNLIYQRSGLFFSTVRKAILEKKVAERIDALDATGIEQYLKILSDPLQGRRELQSLLDRVTAAESSFFRDKPQIDAISQRILPELMEKRKQRGIVRVRIWIAGCASGEDAYTIAMELLNHPAIDLKAFRLELLASDMNEGALKKARNGVYDRYALRSTSTDYLQKYFKANPEERTFRVADALTRSILWKKINLAMDSWRKSMAFDMILCKNVLLYFDDDTKKKIVRGFHDTLNSGGYLFVGQAESLGKTSMDFKLIHFVKAIGYLKN